MTARVEWTGDMDAALVDGLAREFSLTRVADEIGVAEATAARRADHLQLPRRRHNSMSRAATRARENILADLLADGLTMTEARKRMGLTRSAAQGLFFRMRHRLGPQAR